MVTKKDRFVLMCVKYSMNKTVIKVFIFQSHLGLGTWTVVNRPVPVLHNYPIVFLGYT